MALLVTRNNESGNVSEYDGTVLSGAGSTLVVDTTSVLTGTYGLHSGGTGSTNGTGFAYANFTPAGNYAEITYDFKLVSALPTGTGQLKFGHLRREGGIFDEVVWLAYDANSAQWSMSIRQKDGTKVGYALSSSPSVGTWVNVRIVYDATGSNPVASLYLNGSQVQTQTDTSTGTTYIPNQMRLGGAEIAWTAAFECYTDNGKAYDSDSTIVDQFPPLDDEAEVSLRSQSRLNAFAAVIERNQDWFYSISNRVDVPDMPPGRLYWDLWLAQSIRPPLYSTYEYDNYDQPDDTATAIDVFADSPKQDAYGLGALNSTYDIGGTQVFDEAYGLGSLALTYAVGGTQVSDEAYGLGSLALQPIVAGGVSAASDAYGPGSVALTYQVSGLQSASDAYGPGSLALTYPVPGISNAYDVYGLGALSPQPVTVGGLQIASDAYGLGALNVVGLQVSGTGNASDTYGLGSVSLQPVSAGGVQHASDAYGTGSVSLGSVTIGGVSSASDAYGAGSVGLIAIPVGGIGKADAAHGAGLVTLLSVNAGGSGVASDAYGLGSIAFIAMPVTGIGSVSDAYGLGSLSPQPVTVGGIQYASDAYGLGAENVIGLPINGSGYASDAYGLGAANSTAVPVNGTGHALDAFGLGSLAPQPITTSGAGKADAAYGLGLLSLIPIPTVGAGQAADAYGAGSVQLGAVTLAGAMAVARDAAGQGALNATYQITGVAFAKDAYGLGSLVPLAITVYGTSDASDAYGSGQTSGKVFGGVSYASDAYGIGGLVQPDYDLRDNIQSQIGAFLVQILKEHCQTGIVTPADVAVIIREGNRQEDPVGPRVMMLVQQNDQDDTSSRPSWSNGNGQEGDIRIPMIEIGGAQRWWSKWTVEFDIFLVRTHEDRVTAQKIANTVVARMEYAIRKNPYMSLQDDYGNTAFMLQLDRTVAVESGGPPKTFIHTGKMFVKALIEWNPESSNIP